MLTYFKAEGYLSDLNGVALEILNCYRTYCWRDLKLGTEEEADEPQQRSALPGAAWERVRLAAEGGFGLLQTAMHWSQPCLLSDWAPPNKGWEFTLVSNQSTAAAVSPPCQCTRQRLGWHWGYMCWSVLWCFSYTSQSMGGEERVSSLGAECCSPPSALLFLKKRSRNDGVSCRYLHPEVLLPVVSESVASPNLSLCFKIYCNSREGWVMYPKKWK